MGERRNKISGSRPDKRVDVVFTDLDGTLLDGATYQWKAAEAALDLLKRRQIPLVIATSKTCAEVWPLLRALGRREPFVVENGGAIFSPTRYFPFRIEDSTQARRGWNEVVLGAPRRRLVAALARAAHRARVRVRGFNQMSALEVSRLTGLPPTDARHALRRAYDEPFVILDQQPNAWPRLRAEIRRLGLDATRGSRLFHVSGRSDKGAAVSRIIGWFRRMTGSDVASAGLGDSANDIPLLRAVDRPVLVARPTGRYDAETLAAVPHLERARGIGPAGWNRAVLGLFEPVA
jgi:mannosyl-3-phosphoglycerate phosphatase